MKQTYKIFPILTCITISVLLGTILIEPMLLYGQSRNKGALLREGGRDPFNLPSGIHLFAKSESVLTQGTTSTTNDKDILPPSLKVNAILISEHVRLASINRHIVAVGDLIHDEKILEIKTDSVILGKGDKKRTLFLSQSPVLLTVEKP